MGKAALQADVAVITSDNPRTEDPKQIIHDIKAGMKGGTNELFVQPDRKAAIEWALQHCSAGDVVLVAGKGHERHQVIGDTRIPFDDVQVIRDILHHNSLIPS
jgi:UDP-N-acetylmuramoyl-L-alanyl-D-glutamate--2,6-diaminopimelate ligase